MIDALKLLKRRVVDAFGSVVSPIEGWTDDERIIQMARRVREDHGGAGIPANTVSITMAVEHFRRSGSINNFRDLKYVCLGVGLVDKQGWSILADSKLRAIVFSLAQAQAEPRKRFRCFQALLSSYWTFHRYDHAMTGDANKGWCQLRTWLSNERERLLQLGGATFPWFVALARHADLLSDEACRKFGEALLRGDPLDFDDAVKSLAIPENSWVFEETLFAQIRAATVLADDEFKGLLDRMLSLSIGTEGVRFGESLRMRCVARLVSRFAKCADRSENIALRTAAVTTIGNPWLRRAKWDAWVVDSKGKPDDRAREMVNSWLKRRLISDFFTLLAVDGAGDLRRLDYWLRFEPYINDMWFALGTDARRRKTPDFKEFRSSAAGRLLVLTDTTADNNAFVMHIGEYLAVEFGAKGNACFLFKWDSLDGNLVEILSSARSFAEVSLHALKAPIDCELSKQCAARMIHLDSAGETWEQKFDARICPILGRWPAEPERRDPRPRNPQVNKVSVAVPRAPSSVSSPQKPSVKRDGPSPSEWVEFVEAHKLRVEDHRAKMGALWVLGHRVPQEVERQLKAWGFSCRVPRGWYKESL